MAHDHPEAVAARHLNMVLIQAADVSPKTPDELAWAARRAKLAEGSYMTGAVIAVPGGVPIN